MMDEFDWNRPGMSKGSAKKTIIHDLETAYKEEYETTDDFDFEIEAEWPHYIVINMEKTFFYDPDSKLYHAIKRNCDACFYYNDNDWGIRPLMLNQ
jgi:hypothetical protein